MGFEFPQEISEALRKEKVCAATVGVVTAFSLGHLEIAMLFFPSIICIALGFEGEKIGKLSEKMGDGQHQKRAVLPILKCKWRIKKKH